MKEIKITRKLLDEYRDMRKKRTIPILEMELREMREGDNGFGNSTIFDYSRGLRVWWGLIGNSMSAARRRLNVRRMFPRQWRSGSRRSRMVRHGACFGCFTEMLWSGGK